jgi:dTDP-D-glucose 4,6-dehydratase
MQIARKLKKENICEYLLYYVADRGFDSRCGLNMDVLNENVVSKFSVSSDTERKEIYDWYESMIEMMLSKMCNRKDIYS